MAYFLDKIRHDCILVNASYIKTYLSRKQKLWFAKLQNHYLKKSVEMTENKKICPQTSKHRKSRNTKPVDCTSLQHYPVIRHNNLRLLRVFTTKMPRKAISAHFTSKQLLYLGYADQIMWI